MIKKLAWNVFKQTGDINTYLEFIETENIEKQIEDNELNRETKNCGNNDKIDENNFKID